MTNTNHWKPSEIIINEKVRDDPVTINFLNQCPGVPVKYISSSMAKEVVEASDILRDCGEGMLNNIMAGKRVVFIAPAGQAVDEFKIKDDRIQCPHFERLKLASVDCHIKWTEIV